MNNDIDAPLMHTTAGQAGSFIGSIVATLIIPLILLIIFKLIPAMRRRPAISNGIPGALGVLIAFVGGMPMTQEVIVAALVAALFYWQYRRDVTALAKASAPKSPSQS
jgi:hypothetical protein